MEYKRLGQTGIKVSNICLGTMQFGWTAGEELSHQIMSEAVDSGCNFFDTADVYSSWAEGNEGGVSEEIIGRWLSASQVRRQDMVIATKVRGKMGEGPNDSGLSRQHIFAAVDDSLRRLQTDYVDLYQLHWPDEETGLEETLKALDDLVKMGKVIYFGCSNYPAWLLAKALWISDVQKLNRFETVQPHYNLIHRAEFERELQPLCIDQNIGVIPYSPLAGGFLTGKYRRESPLPESARASGVKRRYMNDQGFAVIDRLDEISKSRNATISQVALAWLLGNSAVHSVIIGPRTLEQLTDNMGGATFELSGDEYNSLSELTAWK